MAPTQREPATPVTRTVRKAAAPPATTPRTRPTRSTASNASILLTASAASAATPTARTLAARKAAAASVTRTPATAQPRSRFAPGSAAATPTSRKPLGGRENVVAQSAKGTRLASNEDDSKKPRVPSSKGDTEEVTVETKMLPSLKQIGGDNEPMKAFLRIRPAPEDSVRAQAEPYIQVINDTEVMMNPPREPGSTTASRARAAYASMEPTTYAFSRVFAGEAGDTSSKGQSQAAFFHDTTLPLVRDVLHSQNGLIFTYGVTNSGKSYTVQGGTGPGEAGILPRSLDVIFNSIEGLQSDSDIRPTGLLGIERIKSDSPVPATGSGASGVNPFEFPAWNKKLLSETSARTLKPTSHEKDPTTVKVDRNYRYSVWVSYAEVYNEKVFDLLDVAPPSGSGATGGLTRSSSIRGSNWSIAAMANGTDGGAASGPLTLNRRPLTLKNDPETKSPYAAGLSEIRVRNAAQARELASRGAENRAVFGTLANRSSSRSHGIFTVKIIREHAGATGDMSICATTSRLAIVDLAGSERINNTGASGQRAKEAGSINKSLMVLGQCMEELRKSQARATSAIPALARPGAPMEPRLVTPSQSVTSFRHSKLTALIHSYFTCEGRAVMIVNVNPYDTGFDENKNVFRFSAVAKKVNTMRPQANAPVRSLPRPKTAGLAGASSHNDHDVEDTKRESLAGDVTIIEGSDTEDDQDAIESNPFVDFLLTTHEELRQKVYAAELRCAEIEREVREEMANEMEERLLEMERLYNQRLLNDAEQNEHFVNRKIDLLVKANEQARLRARFASQDEDEDSESEVEDEDDAHEVDQSLAVAMNDMSVASRGTAASEEEEEAEDEDEDEDDEDEDELQDDSEMILRPGRLNRLGINPKRLARKSIDEGDFSAPVGAGAVSGVSDAQDEQAEEVDELDDGNESCVVVDLSRLKPRRKILEKEEEDEEDEGEGKEEEGDEEEEDENDEEADQDDSDVTPTEASDISFDEASDPEDVSFDASALPEADEEEDEDEEKTPEKPVRRGAARRSVAARSPARPRPRQSAPAKAAPKSRAPRANTAGKAKVNPKTKGKGEEGEQEDQQEQEQENVLPDQSGDESLSLIAEERKEPKKKRKLRTKAAVQEDEVLDAIGDSSLVEAVVRSASSGRLSAGTGTGRKSVR